jgi:hypothetical protein
MPLRANLVASARRHLPCQPYAYTRMRGDTIVSLELTQIGINTGAQNQIRFCYGIDSDAKHDCVRAMATYDYEYLVLGAGRWECAA